MMDEEGSRCHSPRNPMDGSPPARRSDRMCTGGRFGDTRERWDSGRRASRESEDTVVAKKARTRAPKDTLDESKWLSESGHPQGMIWSLYDATNVTRTKAGKRKLRLFACGCCRLIWEHVEDPDLRSAVEAAERFADGQAEQDELGNAREDASKRVGGTFKPGEQSYWVAYMVWSATFIRASDVGFGMTVLSMPLAGYQVGGLGGNAVLC